MNWRDFLTPDEAQRLEEIQAENRALKDEHRRIYDRCRKRWLKQGTGNTPGKQAS